MSADAVTPVTPALVAEIERTKADYFTKRAQALIDAGREIKVGRFGHATAFLWPGFNRVYGFGHEDLGRLDELIAWYADDEQTPVFEVVPLRENDEVFARLAALGFHQTSAQSVLCGVAARDLPQPIAVRPIAPDEMQTWAKLYIQAYDWKLEGEEHWKELVTQYTGERWRLCVAEADGRPAGIGALFLGKEIAYLANAATLPTLRGRGGQRSVIAFRCKVAHDEGFEVVASDCSPYGPSQRNLERAALRLATQKCRWTKG